MLFLSAHHIQDWVLSHHHAYFLLPSLVMGIPDLKWRRLSKAGVIGAGILYFGIFILMKAGGDGLRILPYETFLFHDMVPILSDVN